MHTSVRLQRTTGPLLYRSPPYSWETGSPTKPGPGLAAKGPAILLTLPRPALERRPRTATRFLCGCWDPNLSLCLHSKPYYLLSPFPVTEGRAIKWCVVLRKTVETVRKLKQISRGPAIALLAIYTEITKRRNQIHR